MYDLRWLEEAWTVDCKMYCVQSFCAMSKSKKSGSSEKGNWIYHSHTVSPRSSVLVHYILCTQSTSTAHHLNIRFETEKEKTETSMSHSRCIRVYITLSFQYVPF